MLNANCLNYIKGKLGRIWTEEPYAGCVWVALPYA